MKKICLWANLLVLCLLLLGCQKDEFFAEPKTDPNRLTISQAQEWFDTPSSKATQKSTSARKKKQFPPVTPQWHKAREVEDKRYYVVEVPVGMEKKLAFKLKDTQVLPNGLTKLLILKDKQTGRFISALMHVHSFAGADLSKMDYRQIPKDFSGLVFYTSLAGDLVNGYRYEEGKIKTTFRPSGANQSSSARTYCNSTGVVAVYQRYCTVNKEGPDYCTEPEFVGYEYVPICEKYPDEMVAPVDDPWGGYSEVIIDVYEAEPTPPSEEELDAAIYEKPFVLLPDVPCAIVQQWVALAKFTVALSQRQKVEGIVSQITTSAGYGLPVSGNSGYLSKVLDIDNAFSSVVNMDYFGVRINSLPIINGQRATPEQFLNHIRTNINSFVDVTQSEFTPYNHYGVDDRALWNSSNPTGAIVSIDIPLNNGSVIVSQYSLSSWTFSTIKDPFNGLHPVSGNREFGYSSNIDGSYTFYTKGVDRLTDPITTLGNYFTSSPALGSEGLAFIGADKLWKSFQDKIAAYVNNPVNGGTPNSANITQPQTYRPDWDKVKDVVDGKQPLSTLSNDCK